MMQKNKQATTEKDKIPIGTKIVNAIVMIGAFTLSMMCIAIMVMAIYGITT